MHENKKHNHVRINLIPGAVSSFYPESMYCPRDQYAGFNVTQVVISSHLNDLGTIILSFD